MSIFKRLYNDVSVKLDTISRNFGSTIFVSFLFVAIIAWMGLHLLGILHIDGPDFLLLNLGICLIAAFAAPLEIRRQVKCQDANAIETNKILKEIEEIKTKLK